MGDSLAKVGIIPHTLLAVEREEESWPLGAMLVWCEGDASY